MDASPRPIYGIEEMHFYNNFNQPNHDVQSDQSGCLYI